MNRLIPRSVNRRSFLKAGTAGAAAISFWVALRAHAASGARRLLVGVGKRRVTPPLTVPYLTSSGNGTNAAFKSVHDQLFARALVLDDGVEKAAVLVVDSIGYDNAILGKGREFTAVVRRETSKRTGLKPHQIMLAASHTHSAPETIGLSAFRDVPGVAEWLGNHVQELAQTVTEAWKDRAPARAYAGVTRADGIARYRRIVLKNGKLSVHGPLPPPDQVALPWQLDEDLNVVCFEREHGGSCAGLMNYTAHPVVAMLLPHVSADYPGAASALVEEEIPGAVCLFTNGAAGNINSSKVSTNFEDVAALGQKLGQAALAKISELRRGEALKETEVRTCSGQLVLEPRPCPPLAQVEKVASRSAIGKDGAVTRLALKLSEGPLRAEIQAMRLGPVRWISLPGEPFVETGLALKAAGASFVVGYANGYLGYFPIRRAYDEGGYEVVQGAWSRVAPGSAERLESAGKELLEQISRA